MERIVKICLLLFLAGGSFLSAQEYNVNIKGYVLDTESKEPLSNVLVKIAELNKSDFTDTQGLFEFNNVTAGEYNLEVTYEGYKPYTEKILIGADTLNSLLIYISALSFQTPVITITDEHPKSKFDNLLELSGVLKEKELQRNLGQTLAYTLKNETGLSIRSMGPAPSRPVYRGLTGDRVLISEDGIKTSDLSATSPDHSVTVEPFTVERVEVLRGPKVLLKTSTTIGGIVNVVRNEIPQVVPSKFLLKLGGFGETSNKGFLGSSVIEIPWNNFVLRGEGTYRKTGDLKTPEGTLKNSDIETQNYSGGVSYINDWGFAGFSLREYKTDYGIPGGFVGSHPNGVDISMLKRQYNFKFHYNFETKLLDHIDFDISRVYYKHTEYESPTIIGAEFRIINYLGYANLFHNQIGFINRGTAGVSFEARDFNIGGFVFSPPSKSLNLAIYANEEIHAGKKLSLELSARYNYDRVTPEQNIRLSNLDTLIRRTFNTFSLSLSAIYELNKFLNIGLNLSKSSRVPTIEELYSDGPHLAAYSYEIGNPELKDEKGIGAELFTYHKSENIFVMATGFYNALSYYIIPRNTGRINYATLLPIYQTVGVGAKIYGVESQLEIKPGKKITFTASFSYTRGVIKETNSPLPQIPPMKGYWELKYNHKNISFGLNSEMAAPQDEVDDFETPTDGYIIFGAFGQYTAVTGKFIHNISLNIDNITNRIYRNHLSRIKSIIPEPGVNLRVTYKLYY